MHKTQINKSIGNIISGSLSEGFVIRVAPHAAIEQIKTGKFLTIAGNQHTFFSLITDLKLEVTHTDILLFPPSENEKLLNKILHQKDIYATATLKPMLMLNKDGQPGPVKTVPPHFAPVYEATNKDVAM